MKPDRHPHDPISPQALARPARPLRACLAAALTAATMLAPPARAAAAEPALPTLDLTGFDGRVHLVAGATDQIRSNTEGWQLVRRGDSVYLQARAARSTAAPTCGGSAGRQYSVASAASAASAASRSVEIAIPASTRLVAQRYAGTLESSVALVDARLEVGAGTLALTQLVGGEVRVVGPGTATVGAAAGHLTLAVHGPGTVRVQGGRTDRLDATLDGSGLIHHDGVVRHATLAATGDGEIRVRQVLEPPRTQQTGRASITMACQGLACERR